MGVDRLKLSNVWEKLAGSIESLGEFKVGETRKIGTSARYVVLYLLINIRQP
jgi:hypothetical protein